MSNKRNNSNEGLLDLIKELQSNKAYQRLKDRRKASPYVKDDSFSCEVPQNQPEKNEAPLDDQKKWDKLIYDSLTKLEDDSLL